MKNTLLVLLTAIFAISCYGVQQSITIGPQFNYTNIHFDNPSSLDGYAGGLTLGYEVNSCYFASKVFFEGTWNASKLVADPCQRSSTNEYYLQLELGKEFSWCNAYLHPYIGFGWDRFENVQEPQSIALCYQYDKLFIPIGFYYRSNRCPTLSFQFEWRPDVWSQLDLASVNMDPDWGYGFRTQFIYKTFINTRCGCFVLNWAPFFDWNRFGKVKETNSFGGVLKIPRLTRWNLGLRTLLQYNF